MIDCSETQPTSSSKLTHNVSCVGGRYVKKIYLLTTGVQFMANCIAIYSVSVLDFFRPAGLTRTTYVAPRSR